MKAQVYRNDAKDVVVRLDPHDGACNGQHDICVIVQEFHGGGQFMTQVMWEGSMGLLSVAGTSEFVDAMLTARIIARAVKDISTLEEAEMIVKIALGLPHA